MGQRKIGTAKHVWVGLRCRNRDCNRDFLASSEGKALLTELPAGISEETAVHAVDAMTSKMSVILGAIAALHGAKAPASPSVNLVPAFQQCPHCGRLYLYSYSDYFVTMEEFPQTPQ